MPPGWQAAGADIIRCDIYVGRFEKARGDNTWNFWKS